MLSYSMNRVSSTLALVEVIRRQIVLFLTGHDNGYAKLEGGLNRLEMRNVAHKFFGPLEELVKRAVSTSVCVTLVAAC